MRKLLEDLILHFSFFSAMYCNECLVLNLLCRMLYLWLWRLHQCFYFCSKKDISIQCFNQCEKSEEKNLDKILFRCTICFWSAIRISSCLGMRISFLFFAIGMIFRKNKIICFHFEWLEIYWKETILKIWFLFFLFFVYLDKHL